MEIGQTITPVENPETGEVVDFQVAPTGFGGTVHGSDMYYEDEQGKVHNAYAEVEDPQAALGSYNDTEYYNALIDSDPRIIPAVRFAAQDPSISDDARKQWDEALEADDHGMVHGLLEQFIGTWEANGSPGAGMGFEATGTEQVDGNISAEDQAWWSSELEHISNAEPQGQEAASQFMADAQEFMANNQVVEAALCGEIAMFSQGNQTLGHAVTKIMERFGTTKTMQAWYNIFGDDE